MRLFSQEIVKTTVDSGTYSHNLQILFEIPVSDSAERGKTSVFYTVNDAIDAPVLYEAPLYLSALTGERRVYDLKYFSVCDGVKSSIVSKRYIIDKDLPAVPEVSVTADRSGAVVQFAEHEDSIVYFIERTETRWDGVPFSIRNSELPVTLRYFAEDAAGNRTRVYTRVLESLVETKKDTHLEILSPVTGTFGNTQVLYIRHRGLSSIRYTLDGTDPESAGNEYDGPFLIDRTGTVTVRISAESGVATNTTDTVKKEVRYTVIDGQDEFERISNGIVTGDVELRFPRPGGVYTLEDRAPKSWDSVYTDPIRVPAIPGTVKSTVVRYRPLTGEGVSQIEYRYILIMDNRRPPDPVISLSRKIPVSAPLTAEIACAPYAVIRYTLDGSTPDARSTKYDHPIRIELPDTVSTGSLILKAKAFADSGLSSEESSRLITFDREAPSAPRLDTITVANGECSVAFHTDEDSDLLYELSLDGTEPVEPSLGSPEFSNPLTVTLPYGMQADLRLKVAAIDDAGNIAILDEEVFATIDRIPPSAPVIRFDQNMITMTSDEGTIHYTSSDDLAELGTPSVDSTRYQDPVPVDVAPGGKRTVYVSAICVDRSGNSSRIEGPLTFTNDQTIPEMPTYTGVRDGASINAETTHLILGTHPDSVRVAFSTSMDGSEPPDPDTTGPFIDEPLTFRGEPDSRVEYILKVIPVNVVSGVSGPMKRISFVLDLELPELPVLSDFTDGALYNGQVDITVTPSDVDDTVYIVRLPDLDVSLEHSDVSAQEQTKQTVPDPFTGVPVRGVYSLDVPTGVEKVVSFSIGVRDTAGNTSVDPKIYTCTIDRRPPDPPVAELSTDARVSTEKVLVSFVDGEGSIQYEIGVGGAPPAHPNFRSERFSDELVFTGEAGELTVYILTAVRIDTAGNVSSPWTHKFAVDRVAETDNHPSSPKIISNGKEIRIEGGGEIRYETTSDGTEPAIPNLASPVYSAPIPLPETGVMKIRAIRVGESGQLSAATDTAVIYSDPPQPILPYFEGIVDGGVYGEDGALLRLYPVDDSVVVSYSLVEIEENGDTGDTGDTGDSMPGRLPVVEDRIRVPGVADAEIEYFLRIAAIHENSGSVGEEKTFRFTVDRRRPDIPKFSALPTRMRTGMPVMLSADMVDSEGRVFVSMTDDGSFPETPFSGMVLSSSLNLRGTEGRTVIYRIRLGVEDTAGNRTGNPDPYTVIVDREKPAVPSILGIHGDSIFDAPVELRILPGESGEVTGPVADPESVSIYFELSEGETVPKCPSRDSIPYTGLVRLSGTDGERTVYFIRAVAVDESGNVGEPTKAYRIVVDRRRVSSPETPNIAFESDRISISWRTLPDRQIFFRMEGKGAGKYEEYGKPLVIPSSAAEGIKLYYYARFDGGARSPVQEIHLPSPSPEIEFVKGPMDFLVVNEAISIAKTLPTAIVRFEVSTGTLPPDSVDRFSPLLPDTKKFDVAPGETTSFSVRCAIFSQSQKVAERLFQFEIDKTPPPLPVVAGVEDGSYYRNDREIQLTTGEGDIYYSLQRYEDGVYSDGDVFRRYEEPLLLRADQKGIDGYRLSAYSVDEVGNRSKDVAEWSFFFDKEIVYASPYGNDYFEGTRTRPVRTLGAAIKIAGNTERNTIFLGTGDYDIERPIQPDAAISIVGGLDSDDWLNSGEGYSRIRPGKYFPTGKSMFQVQDTRLGLNGIIIDDTTNRSPIVIDGVNADILLTRSTISKGYLWQGMMIAPAEGRLTLIDCEFDGGVSKSGSILNCSGGVVEIESCGFTGNTAETEFIPLVFSSMRSVSISNSTVDPGSGSSTTGVRFSGGNFEAVNSTFNAGVGKLHATAVIIESGTFTAEESTFLTNSRSRLSSCLNVSNSNTTLTDCKFVTGAERGAIALQSRSGELNISSCRFEGTSAEEFLYLIKIDGSKMLIENSVLIGGRTPGDFIGIDCSGGAVKIFGNTMFLGFGDHLAYGITGSGFEWLDIINNIILGRTSGSDFGVAVRAKDARIVSNDFFGWEAVLDSDGERLETVDDLNLSDGNPFGGIHHDNITEQFRMTFSGEAPADIHLSPNSRCINGGFDVSAIGGSSVDMEGQRRPNPDIGIRPNYDIGADEYY